MRYVDVREPKSVENRLPADPPYAGQSILDCLSHTFLSKPSKEGDEPRAWGRTGYHPELENGYRSFAPTAASAASRAIANPSILNCFQSSARAESLACVSRVECKPRGISNAQTRRSGIASASQRVRAERK